METRTEIKPTEKHIGRTFLSNGYVVSTVILLEEVKSIDQIISFTSNLLGVDDRADLSTPGDYETMVFAGKNTEVTDFTELDFRRYSTEADAKIGHEEVVNKWLEK